MGEYSSIVFKRIFNSLTFIILYRLPLFYIWPVNRMKKIIYLSAIIVSVFCGNVSSAQSFTVSFPDTFAYGPAIDSSALSCWTNDFVTNISGTSLVLDIVRVENDTATPGWTSAFCFQSCQAPFIDSLRTMMAPSEVVNVAIHFIITGIPDSGTILMKIKNVNNPSEVVYQRFYGSSLHGSGIFPVSNSKADVTVYPLPLLTGKDFSMFISANQFSLTDLSLAVYTIYGSKLASVNGLSKGTNTLNFNFPAGVYFFTIESKGSVISTGKLIFAD